MAELSILAASDPMADLSPELVYLRSYVRLQAGRVFAGVEERVPAAGGSGDPGTAYVLLLGSPRVLLTAASLSAMRRALDADPAASEPRWVAPSRFAATGLAAAHGVYTLAGYEALEARFLAGEEPAAEASSHLPASLWRAPAFAAAVDERGIESLLGEPRLFAGGAGGAAAGLFHEFIDYYGETRGDILAYLPGEARDVLEVGCGRGATGRLLKAALGCRVTGVELNPAAAAEAALHLDRVIEGDVQELPLAGTFDAVLALEVFEHLTRGEQFLARLKERVRPGGRIVLSVPNVGHYSVVQDLLTGRWDYLPIGLLCYTHYRFFTRRTLEDWLPRCGFERFEIVAQKTPLPADFADSLHCAGLDRESLATKGFYVILYC